MNRKKIKTGAGIGIGYVSVMMIFAVICLTVFAALSLKASDSGNALNKKSAEFTTEYYAADAHAAEILSRIDAAAYEAHMSGFFEDAFPESELPDGVSVSPVFEGFRTDYTVAINEKLNLEVSALFFSDTEAHSGRRYEVLKRRTVSSSEDENEMHLNVWSGD